MDQRRRAEALGRRDPIVRAATCVDAACWLSCDRLLRCVVVPGLADMDVTGTERRPDRVTPAHGSAWERTTNGLGDERHGLRQLPPAHNRQLGGEHADLSTLPRRTTTRTQVHVRHAAPPPTLIAPAVQPDERACDEALPQASPHVPPQ
jgi:hypothetical protein